MALYRATAFSSISPSDCLSSKTFPSTAPSMIHLNAPFKTILSSEVFNTFKMARFTFSMPLPLI